MNRTYPVVTPDDIEHVTRDIERVKSAIHEIVVGQDNVLEALLIAILSGGHVLLEGVPGVGKTLLVRSLGSVLGLRSSRIQFTPDLMPADILGTTLVVEDPSSHTRHFEFRQGPIFAHLVLADEINRATPKTQSALLEAMQEQTVTTLDKTHPIEPPFFVLATQNPVEMEGTYPLPEAQLDRFMMKIDVAFPSATELAIILERTTRTPLPLPEPILSRARLLEMQALVRMLPVSEHVVDYVVRLVRATHPDLPGRTSDIERYVKLGASPRGAQSLLLAAKVRACLRGELACSLDDVKTMANVTLHHRLQLSFEGQADGISPLGLVRELVTHVPETAR
jgi:MoxR-like ATPase